MPFQNQATLKTIRKTQNDSQKTLEWGYTYVLHLRVNTFRYYLKLAYA